MVRVLAVHGSPRKGGNTELLLDEAGRGAMAEGAEVRKVALRDLKITPCLEIYACKKEGMCSIQDDMRDLYQAMDEYPRLIFATPVFFYNVSATAKAFIDRCQARWVRRHWLGQRVASSTERRGGYIAVGATRGKKLFDGVQLTMKYFFDAIDMPCVEKLLIRGVDEKGEILQHPEHLQEAYEMGRRLGRP